MTPTDPIPHQQSALMQEGESLCGYLARIDVEVASLPNLRESLKHLTDRLAAAEACAVQKERLVQFLSVSPAPPVLEAAAQVPAGDSAPAGEQEAGPPVGPAESGPLEPPSRAEQFQQWVEGAMWRDHAYAYGQLVNAVGMPAGSLHKLLAKAVSQGDVVKIGIADGQSRYVHPQYLELEQLIARVIVATDVGGVNIASVREGLTERGANFAPERLGGVVDGMAQRGLLYVFTEAGDDEQWISTQRPEGNVTYVIEPPAQS